MTQKIIRRLGSVSGLIVLALLIVSAMTTDSSAHKAGRLGKHTRRSAHSVRYMKGRHAKLSHRASTAMRGTSTTMRASSKTLSPAEKEEIVQKIEKLAKTSVIAGDHSSDSDNSVIASEASSLDIQAQIAQAAKEEQAEDDPDASIEQFFKERPGAIDANINPDIERQRQEDYTLYDETDPRVTAQRSDIMAQIIDWIGTRYVFGGEDRSGIDCSAFTREVFQKAFGFELPRTAYMQYELGDEVKKQDLQFGDLVFFRTARYAPVTHVGIYIGEGLFANAACSRGVTVASLSSKYWSGHYIGARRLFTNSTMASAKTFDNSGNMADESEP